MTGITEDLARAQAMLAVKRNDEAASLLVRVIASEPEDGRAWCLLAAAHLGAGRYRDAADAADRAVETSPWDEWSHRLVSRSQALLGNTQAAIQAAREACRLAPNEWRAWVCMAQAAAATDFAAAEKAAATARKLAPDEAEVYYASGQVCFAREHWTLAQNYQERALALDPGHTAAINELGRISLKKQNLRRATENFLQAARSAPDERAYERNIYATTWGAMNQLTVFPTWACFLLTALMSASGQAREYRVPGLCAVIVVMAVLAVVRLRALLPVTRALLRTRQFAPVLTVAYGSVTAAVVVAGTVPAHGLQAAWAAFGAVLIGRVYSFYRARHPSVPAPRIRSDRRAWRNAD